MATFSVPAVNLETGALMKGMIVPDAQTLQRRCHRMPSSVHKQPTSNTQRLKVIIVKPFKILNRHFCAPA